VAFFVSFYVLYCVQLPFTRQYLLPYHTNDSHRRMVFIFTRYQKLMQLGSPNVTYKWSTMCLETSLFWGQKVKVRSYKTLPVVVCSLVSAGFY